MMIVKIFTVLILCFCVLIMRIDMLRKKMEINTGFFENKKLPRKYQDVFNRIMDKIRKVSGGECDYEKDYMKIKFNSDDNLPLSKPLKIYHMTITIRSVFEEDGKLHPQIFLDDTLYELNV